MNVIKDIAFVIALFTSMGLFLYGYFEGVRLSDKKGKVRGESVVVSFSLGMVFAMLANKMM
jgi:hypothetical protein